MSDPINPAQDHKDTRIPGGSMSTNEKRLNEIQARLDAATKDWSNQAHESAQVRNFFAHTPRDIADLLAEVHRLRDELARVREITDEKVERACRAFGAATAAVSSIPPGVSETAFIDGVGIQNRYAIRAALETALGGGDDA